jgi:2-hydroxychromene-2-carboxylate isomerase
MPEPIKVTVYNDPGCPWAYSAVPALRVIDWRYGDQLDWRMVLIGLAERGEQYVERGYTPVWMAQAYVKFDRFGMPFSTTPRARVLGTGRACRAIAAARFLEPGTEWLVFRALQLTWFTTQLLLDEDEGILAALRATSGIDAKAIVAHIDDPEVEAAYARDHAEARTAAGSATELQGKAAQTDGPVRYTAPSLVAENGDLRLEAGGFQPVQAYDAIVANVDQTLTRAEAPETPEPLFERFPEGLTTQEVAALLTQGNDEPNPQAAQIALLELVDGGTLRRVDLGDSALWLPAVA